MEQITFLNLHLGYGGIETATINTVNALSKYYDVKIVSFYNLEENQASLINKKVKIKYLYEGGPNKNLFIKALKDKKILKVFKEGIKAFKILVLKKSLIKKEIKNSKSKILVSTRWDFSILLSKYKPKNSIAIAQEHHHHNNQKKYLNVLRKKYKNIDYLFALTTSLAEDYKNIISSSKPQVLVVPNMLGFLPTSKSDLKGQNIISVGRLHEGKKVDDLIRISSKLKNLGKFYIIGDGDEYDSLNKLVKELNLEEKIEFLGYKTHQEIEKYFLDSSLFVMASVSEGLPMVLLEAMSYGIPCVAYEVLSGVSDIIDNNKNGFIIKDRNEQEFVKAVDYLLLNNGVRKEFKKEALEKSLDYSEENIIKIWQKVLVNHL